MKQVCKRIAAVTVCVALLCGTVGATGAAFLMTVRDGFICVRDARSGQWLHETQIPADALSPRDRLLLETGVLLRDRAALTRALEDFCS